MKNSLSSLPYSFIFLLPLSLLLQGCPLQSSEEASVHSCTQSLAIKLLRQEGFKAEEIDSNALTLEYSHFGRGRFESLKAAEFQKIPSYATEEEIQYDSIFEEEDTKLYLKDVDVTEIVYLSYDEVSPSFEATLKVRYQLTHYYKDLYGGGASSSPVSCWVIPSNAQTGFHKDERTFF